MPRRTVSLIVAAIALASAALHVEGGAATTLPAGVVETPLATGLSQPTAMTQMPDGRFLVAQQTGALRVVDATGLLPAPMLSVAVNAAGERGLLGVAVDPDFATSPYVYVYYTTSTGTLRNRVSRFTISGDTAVAGSQELLFELDPLSAATNHNGGALHFGRDGKLYIGVGDNARGANAPSIGTVLGKVLRINRDGTIPADNPFADTATGTNRAIWAVGLRNPFTFAVQPGTGRTFVNDVGQSTWEEIDELTRGGNYGWPTTEGATTDPAFISPVFAYNHVGGGCAISGAAFYNPAEAQFPADHTGDYLFGDYCGGWIHRLDTTTGDVATFASDIGFGLVDLLVEPSGSVAYLTRTGGRLVRISNAAAPTIADQPQSQTVETGSPVTFRVVASNPAGVAYQWQRDGIELAGETRDALTLPTTTATDDGATFRVRLTSPNGATTSAVATLTVTTNRAPKATITAPTTGRLYRAGDPVAFAGSGSDPEDGPLGPDALTWRVDFHHAAHTHPFASDITGASGEFTPPASGHVDANVWFRIHLTVRDAQGHTDTTFVDVHPRTVGLTLTTDPPGLRVRLDDQVLSSPVVVRSVVGMRRAIGVVSPQAAGPDSYGFTSWSDGGAPTRTIATPENDLSLVARYAPISLPTAQEAAGVVVLEAESADAQVSRGGKTWRTVTSPAGFVGSGAVLADPNTGSLIDTGYATRSAQLDYRVRFATPGTYQVWLRVRAANASDDTAHIGLDGVALASADRIQTTSYAGYVWTRATRDNVDATVSVPTAATRIVNLWMREDGLVVDRILLSTDPAFIPSGNGPATSPRSGSAPVDVDPPTVNTRVPAPGAAAAAPAAPIEVTFSEGVAPASITGSSVRLTRANDGVEVPAIRSVQGSRLVIDPDAHLELSTTYRVELTDAVTDPTGNEMAPVSWTFTTSATAEPPASEEAAGMVVLEAEGFDALTPRGGKTWRTVTSPAGFVGAGAVLVDPNTGGLIDSGYATTSSQLDYRVRFATPGTYQVWLRVRAANANDDTAHVGLDGAAAASADRIQATTYTGFVWTRATRDNVNATVAVPAAATRTVNLWMREDGLVVDRILLSTDAAFIPSGNGPAASPRR